LFFIPVHEQIIKTAAHFFSHYKLKPRDAIHMATAHNSDIKNIISEDSDFDKISLIERIWLDYNLF